MTATFRWLCAGREKPRRAGCRAGLVVDVVSPWWSVCRGGGFLG